MPPQSDQIATACSHCDLPVAVPFLQGGERADCPRCGATILKRCKDGWQRVACFSLAALIALSVACSYSYLSLDSAGGDASASVVDAAWGLITERPALGACVGLFFLGFPALQCLSILGLSISFLIGNPSLKWKRVAFLIERLQPWCMVDVFLLGTLVSLIKVASLAKIEFGYSFWALVAFVVFLTASYTSLDTRLVVSSLHRKADGN